MRTIAVIEDDEKTNNALRGLLESLGDVEVHQAFNRESAEILISSQRLDLVIMDIELGEGPKEKHAGLKLLSQLSSMRCPTIVVSGMPEANLQSVSLSLSAYDFIGKPINELDFVSKAEHALAWRFDADDARARQAEQSWPAGLKVDPDRKPGLQWKEVPVRLTLTELGIVHCLADAAGKTIVYSKLAQHMKSSQSPSALATHIAGVRKKFLDVDATFDQIESEPGKGYVWKVDP